VKQLRQVAAVDNAPTTLEQTMEAIESGIVDQGLNRIVVAGFSPRAYEEIFRDACAKAGLNPYLLEMVNLREQCAWVLDKEDATKAAMSQMTMAVERARYLEPIPLESYPVTPKALVVGGGVAGTNAALDIAEAGYDVFLVEKDAVLGGRLMEATELQSGEKAEDFVQQIVEKVKRNKKIKVYTKAAVKDVRGRVGAFKARMTGEGVNEEIDFGVAVLATGAKEFVPAGYYGYGQDKKVMTQSEFAKLLEGTLEARTIVLIQDAIPDVGVPSKYSSIEAVSNALKAKKKNPAANVFLLYQETKTYGKWETLYKEAREHGVIFLRYDKERPPQLADGILSVFDLILNDELQIKPDLLVLSTPMLPAEENEELSKLFMVPLNRYGFFMEEQERPKLVLTPVDTANEGVFICGSAVYPGMVDETLAMSSAAAARASVILAKNFLETPGIVSVVDEEICSGCGVCVELCPVEAIELVEEPVSAVTYGIMTVTGGTRVYARVTEGCIGCGSCASLCPSSAMSLKNFKDRQMFAQVDFA
jgi:heterodisulfide reductase subunit A